MKHIDKLAHLILLLGFAVGTVAYFREGPGQDQFLIAMAMVVFYLVWGFTYHHLRGDVTNRLLLEYLTISAIASLVNVMIFAR